jgi:hypothetical protein
LAFGQKTDAQLWQEYVTGIQNSATGLTPGGCPSGQDGTYPDCGNCAWYESGTYPNCGSLTGSINWTMVALVGVAALFLFAKGGR